MPASSATASLHQYGLCLLTTVIVSACVAELPQESPVPTPPASGTGPSDDPNAGGGEKPTPPSNPPATAGLRIGLWISPWELNKRTPQQYIRSLRGLTRASSYSNRPLLILSLCGATAANRAACQFQPPPNLPQYANIDYGQDLITPFMDAIEAEGDIDVILLIEPMAAHVSELTRVVMTKYGNYKAVKGLAPDWEWVRGDGDKASKIAGWIAELAQYKANMEYHMIGWELNVFGATRDATMTFGYDGQGFANLEQQLNYFRNWHSGFAPNRSGVYWGYSMDASWMRPLVNSPQGLKQLQDRYRDLNPNGMILLATEQLYFDIEPMLQTL